MEGIAADGGDLEVCPKTPPVSKTPIMKKIRMMPPKTARRRETGAANRSCVSSLSDLNFEKSVIRVRMTPTEVRLLLGGFGPVEFPIVPVLLGEVSAVGTIFLI